MVRKLKSREAHRLTCRVNPAGDLPSEQNIAFINHFSGLAVNKRKLCRVRRKLFVVGKGEEKFSPSACPTTLVEITCKVFNEQRFTMTLLLMFNWWWCCNPQGNSSLWTLLKLCLEIFRKQTAELFKRNCKKFKLQFDSKPETTLWGFLFSKTPPHGSSWDCQRYPTFKCRFPVRFYLFLCVKSWWWWTSETGTDVWSLKKGQLFSSNQSLWYRAFWGFLGSTTRRKQKNVCVFLAFVPFLKRTWSVCDLVVPF